MVLACNLAEEENEDIWFLDSGCSNHMTGNILMFSMLDEHVKSQVTLGTNSKVSVMGKGSVSVWTNKRDRKTISDVYYVPGMKLTSWALDSSFKRGTIFSLKMMYAPSWINHQERNALHK